MSDAFERTYVNLSSNILLQNVVHIILIVE